MGFVLVKLKISEPYIKVQSHSADIRTAPTDLIGTEWISEGGGAGLNQVGAVFIGGAPTSVRGDCKIHSVNTLNKWTVLRLIYNER